MNRTASANRKKIEKALLKCMKKKPYENITVSEVCAEAGLSRTAFYRHFTKMDDVLLDAYETAHEEAFGAHEWTVDYFRSDQFIHDMISFFDNNTDLLLTLRYWDLLGRIASFPTAKSLVSASEEKDKLLSEYPAYTMVYFWSGYFTICSMWLNRGKQETPQELFEIIRYMNRL